MNIGIDIGRVLICPTIDGQADTRFLGKTVAEALPTPPAEGAFAVVHDLVEATRGHVWLVSKAGPSVERKTRLWLEHHDFYARTGMTPDQVRFCRQRHEKADHCSELGIEAFLDDRRDVLEHLRGQVEHLLLFGEQDSAPPDWVTHLGDWKRVREWFDVRVELPAGTAPEDLPSKGAGPA